MDILVESFNDKRFFAFAGFFVDLEEALEKKIDLVHAEALDKDNNPDKLSLKFRDIIYEDRVKIYG